MKSIVVLLMLAAMAGCQAPERDALAPTNPAPAPIATPAPTDAAEARRTTQLIEALANQNDALRAELKKVREAAAAASPPPGVLEAPRMSIAPVVNAPPEPVIAADGHGIVDLARFAAPKPGEPVNPFVVRKAPEENIRETELQVSGVVAGPEPMALMNGDLVRVGATISGFRVQRIDANAVIVEHRGHRVRIPVGEKSVRIRTTN